MRVLTRIAVALLVLVPPAQWALERFVTLPIAPSRTIAIGLCLLALGPVALAGVQRLRGASLPLLACAALMVLAPVGGAAALLVAVRSSGGPFGPIPGGRLSGTVSAERHPDWDGIDRVRYVALQTASHRSIEMLAVREGDHLYVAANYPERKRWPHELREEPAVVVRVGDTLYPRHAVFVESPRRRKELLGAMNAKYGFDVSMGTGRAWFFRLDPPVREGGASAGWGGLAEHVVAVALARASAPRLSPPAGAAGSSPCWRAGPSARAAAPRSWWGWP